MGLEDLDLDLEDARVGAGRRAWTREHLRQLGEGDAERIRFCLSSKRLDL